MIYFKCKEFYHSKIVSIDKIIKNKKFISLIPTEYLKKNYILSFIRNIQYPIFSHFSADMNNTAMVENLVPCQSFTIKSLVRALLSSSGIIILYCIIIMV